MQAIKILKITYKIINFTIYYEKQNTFNLKIKVELKQLLSLFV